MLNRRDFLKTATVGTMLSAMSDYASSLQKTGSKRPNILWLSAEDISPHVGCYGAVNAKTLVMDRFAQEGVRFTHAFTVHGVCAPVRSSIITGMYPSTLGSCAMRCRVLLPEWPVCFTEHLRQAGYYCCNNDKEDYNFNTPPGAWDDSNRTAHYKNRPEGKPFFAVFNFLETHESKIWNSADFEKTRPPGLSKEEYQNPDDMIVPPLFPDTPEVRRDLARLHERMTQFDHFVRDKLAELKAEGLQEDTIVFIWSDHGDGLPRYKRWLYDTGTHVPLMVQVPETFRLEGQANPGTVDDRMINLLDLGPTALNLAGVSPPQTMQGRPFLGPNLQKPTEYVFGARDRNDEIFDLIRAVRDRRYRYIRNLNPWLPYFPYTEYTQRCNTMKAMRRLQAEGKLPPASAQWMAARRPPEELYDLHADPYEVCNLADNPAYTSIKERLSQALTDWMVQTRDTGLLPEPILRIRARQVGSEYAVLQGSEGEAMVKRLVPLAMSASNPKSSDKKTFLDAMKNPDAAVRYWAVVGLGLLKGGDSTVLEAIEDATADQDVYVRIAAARSLFWNGQKVRSVHLLGRIATAQGNVQVMVFALHVIEMLEPTAFEVIAENETIMEMIHRYAAEPHRDWTTLYIKRICEKLIPESSEYRERRGVVFGDSQNRQEIKP